VALGLKAEKPVVLLRAAPEAAAFFRRVTGAGRLLEAERPEEAVRLAAELVQQANREHAGPAL
jgi:hypothetical protein